MTTRTVDWKQLEGHVFQTTTGARFTVVKVTAKNLLVQPEGGRRNYDLSIHDELERGIEAYSTGRFFPSPSELLGIGVRAVRTSYVWGVLHQLLIQDELPKEISASRTVTGITKLGKFCIEKHTHIRHTGNNESLTIAYR